MRYVSLFSGIEAASVAWEPLGWEPVAFAEIEKFPSKVLAHHYPDVPNLGDVTKVDWNEFRKTNGSIDLVVFGSPCQSFSIAGKRLGLNDPRGNLALYALKVVSILRPTWFLFENVPGLLSSDEGRDFGAFLGAVGECGYQCSWRILDAQYFGVPQRRRRVFVVGHLGDWRDSAKVLFEPESLRRNPPPRRESRQGVAPTLSARTKGGGGLGSDFECDGGLIPSHDPAVTLTAREYKGPLPEADLSPVITQMVAAPLTAGSSSPGVSAPGRRQEDDENIVAFAQNQRDEVRTMDVAGALAAKPGMKQQTYVAFTASDMSNKAAWESDVYPTLNAQVPSDTSNIQYGVRSGSSVRRLTPTECERLQGFPDGYTKIPKSSDSGRYKALGNSMAVPVMHWIGSRINAL